MAYKYKKGDTLEGLYYELMQYYCDEKYSEFIELMKLNVSWVNRMSDDAREQIKDWVRVIEGECLL